MNKYAGEVNDIDLKYFEEHVWEYGGWNILCSSQVQYDEVGTQNSPYSTQIVHQLQMLEVDISCTIFVCIHAHAQIHAHCSQNSSRTWNFLCEFCILQLVSSAKCGNNIDISKLCMQYSGHVSLLYQWMTRGVD